MKEDKQGFTRGWAIGKEVNIQTVAKVMTSCFYCCCGWLGFWCWCLKGAGWCRGERADLDGWESANACLLRDLLLY